MTQQMNIIYHPWVGSYLLSGITYIILILVKHHFYQAKHVWSPAAIAFTVPNLIFNTRIFLLGFNNTFIYDLSFWENTVNFIIFGVMTTQILWVPLLLQIIAYFKGNQGVLKIAIYFIWSTYALLLLLIILIFINCLANDCS